jgi:hypothetical protein
MRRQEQASTLCLPTWNRQQGSLLAQVLVVGVMVQVVIAVILLNSILPQGEGRNLIPEDVDFIIGPPIQPLAISVQTPMGGLVRSHPNGDQHDPTQRRNSITFTTMPDEIPRLQLTVNTILDFMTLDPENTFDAIHLCVPDRPMRSKDAYPSTLKLQAIFTDPRIIIHRLPDYGPMTRYLGPLAYEKHPESAIILFDVDSNDLTYDLNFDYDESGSLNHTRDIIHLVHAARNLDESAMWCNQGENFAMNEFLQVRPNWDLFPRTLAAGNYSWNHVHFCRGVGGMLFKPKHFVDFWYNQSEYHESCFWDDDRWVSYQLERQGFPLKVVHVPEAPTDSATPNSKETRTRYSKAGNKKSSHRRLGSLTEKNFALQSDQMCPVAWLTKHSDAYPTARVRSGTRWIINPYMVGVATTTLESIANLTGP